MVRLLCDRSQLLIETYPGADLSIKAISQRFGCEHNDERGILRHIPKSIPWIVGIKRHIGRTGFKHGHQCNDHLQGSFKTNTHCDPRSSAQRLEIVCQLIRPDIELTVSQCFLSHRQRHSLRRPRDLCFKQLGKTFKPWIVSLRAVPILQHLSTLGGSQCRKLG